jgi:hypothetical protein
MLYRMKNNNTYISLSGLPEFPTTQVPLGAAAWYIFASAVFNNNPKTDLIRLHLPHISLLKQLVDLVNYKIPDGVIVHVQRIQIMLSMLRYCKKHGNIKTDIIRPLTRKCEKIEKDKILIKNETIDRFIPLDGPPQEQNIIDAIANVTAWENVPINVLVGLASKVDPSKSAGDIELPITWTPPILPKYHNFWTKPIIPFERVCICPSTCRPYYNVNGKRWSENLFEKYGLTPESTVSCNELFGNFIVKHKKYPTKDELMIYCYNRMIVHGSHTTLPEEMMDQYIESTLNDNKQVMSIYTPEESAKRFLKSRSIVIRIEMEKS